MKEFVLLTVDGLVARTGARETIDLAIKHGVFRDEFKFEGDLIDARPAGDSGDLQAVIDCVNQGVPIIFIKTSTAEYYAIPQSFRDQIAEVMARKSTRH